MKKIQKRSIVLGGVLLSVASVNAMASCDEILSTWQDSFINSSVGAANNGGFGFPVWIAAVDETGKVCAVVNSSSISSPGTGTTGTGSTGTGTTGTGTPGTGTTGTGTSGTGSTSATGLAALAGATVGNMSSLGNRLIAIQKASTASAFSFDSFSISTANLYGLTVPGGSLYGLQFANPAELTASSSNGTGNLGGSSDNTGSFGQGMSDPAVGTRVGGVVALGGGLALYNSQRVKVGAIGVSGDTSCTDHAIAWRLRTAMNLNNVPAGFGSGPSPSPSGAVLGDEMVISTGNNLADITNTYKHPSCAITTAVTDPIAGSETGVVSGTGTGTTGTGTTGTGTTGTGTTGTGTTGTGTTGTGTTGTGTTGTGTTGTGTTGTGTTGTGTTGTGTTGTGTTGTGTTGTGTTGTGTTGTGTTGTGTTGTGTTGTDTTGTGTTGTGTTGTDTTGTGTGTGATGTGGTTG